MVLWTDAITMLHWLNTSAVLSQFAQNRINEIRQVSDLTFRYVPSEHNPADLATRKCTAIDIRSNTLWWHEPSWLIYEKLWPSMPESLDIPITPAVTLVVTSTQYQGFLTDARENNRKFRFWNSYVRILMRIFKFGTPKLGAEEEPLVSVVELFRKAELHLIQELQTELAELKKGKSTDDLLKKKHRAFKLMLGLDSDGLIRCKGRIQNASFPWEDIEPILLPRNNPLVWKYIYQLHVENHHIGCSHLLIKLRERFWIIKGRAKVKSVLAHCVACNHWEGGRYRLPTIPYLLLCRVAEVSPFLHTGVDYLGPLHINNSSDDGSTEVWVAIFVCLVTRVVHLELANNLSTDEFLMALSRFCARRGVS